MQLTHKDVYLNYFEYIQPRVNKLQSGDSLKITENGCTNSKDQLVLKFSQKFLDTIKLQDKKGYKLKKASVNFIVYWNNEESGKEVKIVLPEVYFENKA